jgi:hypothetical protein
MNILAGLPFLNIFGSNINIHSEDRVLKIILIDTMKRNIILRDCRTRLRMLRVRLLDRSLLGEEPLRVFIIFLCALDF